MIELTNIDQSVSFEFDIVRYEFPDNVEDDWCLVRVCVTHGEERFEHVDPALEANEIVNLAEWFGSLLRGEIPEYTTLTFTEPCLQFELLGRTADELVRMTVCLDIGLKPPFNLRQLSHDYEDEWVVVFLLSVEQLKLVKRQLDEFADRFPKRSRG